MFATIASFETAAATVTQGQCGYFAGKSRSLERVRREGSNCFQTHFLFNENELNERATSSVPNFNPRPLSIQLFVKEPGEMPVAPLEVEAC